MSAVLDRVTLTVSDRESAQAAAVAEEDLAKAIPEELAGVLANVARVIARGGSVTVGTLPEEITTTTAASMLGISRPTLMKLIKNGSIPARKVGTHTRLKSADVIDFRSADRAERSAAFDELRRFEDEAGLAK